MKATWGSVNGFAKNIFKNPKTDSGFKKSAKGLLQVYWDDNGKLALKDNCSYLEEEMSLLTTVYKNGTLVDPQSLSEIRARLLSNLK